MVLVGDKIVEDTIYAKGFKEGQWDELVHKMSV